MQRLELRVGVGEERGALPAEPELQHVGRPAQRVGVRAELAVDVTLHVEVAVGVRAQSKAHGALAGRPSARRRTTILVEFGGGWWTPSRESEPHAGQTASR